MQLNNLNREELQKRQEGLESTAMMMAAQGLPIPQNIEEELQEVRGYLNALGGAIEVAKPWTSWLGHILEGFTLKERLSSGTYSHVFRAVNEKSNEETVFKIASTPNTVSTKAEDFFKKQAIVMNSEICGLIDISANLALELECRRLRSSKHSAFVKVLSSGVSEECFYYRMQLHQGESLKELMATTDMPFLNFVIEIFARLCEIVEAIGASEYHGNLQPDSIFISKTDIVLLSPGAFEAEDPLGRKFMLCTPAYYPFFEANDLFALGCTFWEAVLKQHPLATADHPEKPEQFAADLKEMLEYRKALNHSPLWHFIKFNQARNLRPNLSERSVKFMMKAIKLAYDSDGFITGSPGFSNAKEFAQELKTVGEKGILTD